MSIIEAKRKLGRELRSTGGFVGVGLGEDSEIRVYVIEEGVEAAQILLNDWGGTYEGFPVKVVLSSGFSALPTDP